MFRISRIRLQLLAQLQNLVIDGSSCRIEVVSPNLVQQDVTREHALGIIGKELQELELMRGEHNRPAAAQNGHLLKVNFAIAKAISGLRSWLALAANGC